MWSIEISEEASEEEIESALLSERYLGGLVTVSG
jgi:hypothetical protein